MFPKKTVNKLKILILTFSIFFAIKGYSQLSGTYTVGGSSPYFPNLDSAFNYMEIKGVSGNVRLNVRSGSYTLRTTISTISGASSSKMIQVAPDPANTAPVIFRNSNPTQAKNFLINIKQSFLRFDSLEFRLDSNSSYGKIITFNANCSAISFNSCSFIGKDSLVTNDDYAIIQHGPNYNVNYLKILNCNFYNSSFMIFFWGHPYYNKYDTGIVIKNNRMINYSNMAIYLSYQENLEVEGNYAIDNNKFSVATGFYITSCRSPIIARNRIYTTGQAGFGLIFNLCQGTIGKPSLVHSNFISGYDTSKSGTFQSLFVTRSNYVSVYFNTTATFNKSNAAIALSIDLDTNAYFYNNINYSRTGVAVKISSGSNSGIKKLDYNLLYSGGTNLAAFGNTNYSTLANYTNAMKLDSHSINKNLVFAGFIDLHTLSIDLYQTGYPQANAPNDIDGILRNSAKPDIGAHVQHLPTLDLSATGIDPKFCMKGSDVYVRIRNLGFTAIDSCKIIWQVSENGGTFSTPNTGKFYGSLNTGKDTLVKVGYFNFPNRTNYRIKAWVKTPNGKVDSLATNDTIQSKPVQVTMNGKYTIGGNTPDFPTIDSALNTLERVGMCGPIKLSLRSGTYNEKVEFNPISGLNSSNTLLLISDSANSSQPIITYTAKNTADNAVLLFSGVSYITIKGIGFQSKNSTYGRVVEIRGSCSNLTFLKDSFVGTPGATGTTVNNVVIYNYAFSSSLLFKDCGIMNGNYGFYFTTTDIDVEISHCRILGFSYCGIYNYNQQRGIIAYNYLQDDNSQDDPIGIYSISNYNSNILNNKILIGGRKSPGGLVLVTCNSYSQSNPTLIANNIISMYNSSATGTVTGIYFFNCYYTKLIYNMSFIAGGDSNTSTAIYNDHKVTTFDMYNNIFNNYGKGYTAYFKVSSPGVLTSNNNNFWTNGKRFAYYNTNCAKLSDLKSASGNESKSITADALYSAPDKLEKKVVELDNKGVALSDVKKDFHDIARDTLKTDIGPWEFTSEKNDIAALGIIFNSIPKNCGEDSSEVSLIIKNTGSDSMVNIKIYIAVSSQNYANLDSNIYKKKLMPGMRDTVRLRKFKTKGGGYFDITASIGKDNNTDWQNDVAKVTTWYINSTPAEPSPKTDTICDNQTYRLTTTHPGQSKMIWYKAPTGREIIDWTDTMTINNIRKDTTFYITSSTGYDIKQSFLRTIASRGTSCRGGIMFNLKPKLQLRIDTFNSIFANTGYQKVNIYMKKGTYIGFETDSSKWNLVDTITSNPLSTGSTFYPIQLHRPIFLEKDSTYGIYLNFNAQYTSGTFTYSTTELILNTGTGLCSRFDSTTTNMIFNGRIAYTTFSSCDSKRVPFKLKVKKSPVLKNIGNDTAYCANSGIKILLDPGSGFKSYRWSNGDTVQSIYAKDAGTYSVEVTGQNLCKEKDKITISKNINPLVNIGPDLSYCASDGISKIIGPAGIYNSYLWNNGIKNRNIRVSTFGKYSITVTDIKDCKGYDTLNVVKLDNPVVNLGNDTTYCSKEGIKLLLDAGKGNKNYKWSTKDTTQTILTASKGKYRVEVGNNFGCKTKDSIEIIEKTSPVVKLPNDTFYCNKAGANLTLNAGSGLMKYLWSTNDTTQMLFVDSQGIYSVIVTAFNDCKANDSIVVSAVTDLIINLGKDTGYCKGNTFNLSLNPGTGYKTYLWSTAATTPTITVQSKGQYSVFLKDIYGCTGRDTIKVSEINPKVSLGKDTAYCANSGIDKILDAGPGFIAYEWLSGEKTQIIHAKKDGNYIVKAKALYNCFAHDTLIISKNTNPIVNLGADRILNPDLPVNETLDAGSGYKSYLWNTSASSQTISVSSVGFYSVVVSNNKGCDGKDTVQVRFWNKTNLSPVEPEQNLVRIYPNPANNILQIESEHYMLQELMIIDITGKNVFQLIPNEKTSIINTTDLSEGVYLVSIKVNGNLSQFKLIISH